MDASEKGRRYALIFRKAGTFIGKGENERAIKALREGFKLAQESGDNAMARRFSGELERIEKAIKSG
ncbi:MAG: hypothetical protein ACREP6_02705 [Candidatus Binataceae bacterium]